MDLLGLIPAAGRSTRMGGFPKPLLCFDGDRFVERIIDRVQSVGATPCVVLGYEADEIRDRASLDDVIVLVNDEYESGEMLASVQTGVREATARGDDGFIMWPVDYPCVSLSIVEQLVATFERGNVDVVVPTYRESGGHPALFGSETFDLLLDAPADEGARAVVYDDSVDKKRFSVSDPGIHADIDTPAEYWEAVRRFE